jgi:hypothetical protein
MLQDFVARDTVITTFLSISFLRLSLMDSFVLAHTSLIAHRYTFLINELFCATSAFVFGLIAMQHEDASNIIDKIVRLIISNPPKDIYGY